MNSKQYNMKRFFLTLVLLLVMIVPIFSNLIFVDQVIPVSTPKFDSGDTAWMIVASVLVLLMTPGLAFFYGGLVGKNSVITTMLQSFLAMVVIAVLWLIVGYSLSFGPSIRGIIGDPSTHFFFQGVGIQSSWILSPTTPLIIFAVYQMMFAIITPALISGSFAERINLLPYILFIALFSLFVYAPIAHMTWHPDGFFFKLGVLDFAGGTVVHMSAGWAALAGAIYLGERKLHVSKAEQVPYVLLGTGILWIGWLGFNGGSALAANGLAAQAIANSVVAAAAGGFAWMFLDKIRGYQITAVETCLGILVGLVAITPASGYVSIEHAVSIGCIASIISYIIVSEFKIINDALDVFGCHALGGISGMLLTGVFANKAINPAITEPGLLFGGSTLIVNQIIAIVIVSVFSFAVSYLLFIIVNAISPIKVSEQQEIDGLDGNQFINK